MILGISAPSESSLAWNGSLVNLALILGAGMLVLDIVLILAAKARFKRAKLILD
jgi:hypothetical protein